MTVPSTTRPGVAGAADWQALVAAALIGTARRPPPPSPLLADLGLDSSELTDLTGETDNWRPSPRDDRGEERRLGAEAVRDPAAALLTEAAVLSAYRRAGRLAAEAPRTLPAPAEPDDRPPCSTTAVEVLELILSGEVPIPGGVALLAGQWLDGAARAGRRVPARLLPSLLDLGSTSPALQPALRTVVGSRGRWLAGHHHRWEWATGEALDDLDAVPPRFATAAKTERPALLEAVRRADPARGLELLRSTWKSDPAAERAALLAVLAVGLSDDDEPFLEEVLDDRSAVVRQVAVDLLGRLPASRRAARMADRLRVLVERDDSRGGALSALRGRGRTTLSFAQPGEPDAAARRDGINDAAPTGMGVLAWRLAQLVGGTPLSFWAEQLGLTPAETAALATVDGESIRKTRPQPGGRGAPAGPLLLGLEAAVIAQTGHADPDWAIAVFAQRPSPRVLAVLPPGLAAEQLTRLLGSGLGPSPAVAELFAACPGPWPQSL
ncbi:MAG TPA: DUF5691 domain-containing protein, partial [Acidimicrobiia bacterium]|nr:DUF5691 domain-containing protein [Acidimicrobiia bacterium]